MVQLFEFFWNGGAVVWIDCVQIRGLFDTIGPIGNG